jgi:hypothetical protein
VLSVRRLESPIHKGGHARGKAAELPLYHRLIGERWPDLADSLRAFLGTAQQRRFRGRVRIERSTNGMARLVARLLGLPKPSESMPAELAIIPERGCEIWRRTFGDRTLTTRQSAGPGGTLMERYGLLEFSFVLRVENGGLHFDQAQTTIHLASFRLRMPGWMSPRVSAVCEAVARINRTHASVRITAPVIGTVLAYDGDFEIEE